LRDLEGLTMDELSGWMAFYEIEREEIEER
jgi:hypothetical protein